MRKSHQRLRAALFATALGSVAMPALAHHGFGLFQMTVNKTWTGTITRMNLVNPHSYMEFDAVDENGKTLHMRCGLN